MCAKETGERIFFSNREEYQEWVLSPYNNGEQCVYIYIYIQVCVLCITLKWWTPERPYRDHLYSCVMFLYIHIYMYLTDVTDTYIIIVIYYILYYMYLRYCITNIFHLKLIDEGHYMVIHLYMSNQYRYLFINSYIFEIKYVLVVPWP